MDYSREQSFVQKFIRKDRRRRILYELTTPEKRYEGISRFCHQAEELLQQSKIVMEGDDIVRSPEFKRFVKQNDEVCFIMSPYSFIDGQFLSLKEAVSEAVMCPDAVVICGSTFAVVFGEPMKGDRGIFLLTDDQPGKALNDKPVRQEGRTGC